MKNNKNAIQTSCHVCPWKRGQPQRAEEEQLLILERKVLRKIYGPIRNATIDERKKNTDLEQSYGNSSKK